MKDINGVVKRMKTEEEKDPIAKRLASACLFGSFRSIPLVPSPLRSLCYIRNSLSSSRDSLSFNIPLPAHLELSGRNRDMRRSGQDENAIISNKLREYTNLIEKSIFVPASENAHGG